MTEVKTAEIKWSDNQRDAIGAANAEVLVSAGAGSGKTAVLVERVIQLVLNANPPVQIEQILAVTFTEEAAAQMRRRIDTAIRARLQSGPNPLLERQLALLERSWISTIDAFCLRLIRENFQALGLDPQMEVLGEEEARLLKLDAADSLFQRLYDEPGKAGERFRTLVEHYGGVHHDEGLRDAMLSLHAIFETVLDPKAWLRNAIEQYQEPLVWITRWRDCLLQTLNQIQEKLESCLSDMRQQHARRELISVANEDITATKEALKALTTRDVNEAWRALPNAELSPFPRKSKDGPEHECLKGIHLELSSLLKQASAATPAAIESVASALMPFVRDLGILTQQFRRDYSRAKREQAAVDFSDLKRNALRLLRNEDIAEQMRSRFVHVIIDEYQDINPLEDEILRRVSRTVNPNRFMVGDVKQCIYGFRLAEPGLFVEKLSQFQEVRSADRRKIFLPDNYRSRAEILNSVNTLFERILAPTLGGLTFRKGDHLKPEAVYPPVNLEHPVELLLIDCKEDAAPQQQNGADSGENGESPEIVNYSNLQCQALEIGRRILDWTGRNGKEPLQVLDQGTKTMRPARAGDMAILMRSVKERAAPVIETLNSLGIEVITTRESTFFESVEVMDILAVLHVLDNPRQDIPLAAVLRSPMFNFSEEELAQITIDALPQGSQHHTKFFHESVREFLKNRADSELAAKLREAFERIEQWRTMSRTRPLADVIRHILDETGYADFVLGMRGGEQRRARLDALLEKARQFSSFHRPTLYRFLRFIEDLAKQEIEMKAPPPPPAGDAVRLMTIHQSKGLEFPVVFLPDIDKEFNIQDARGNILLDRSGGVGMLEVYPEDGTRRKTVMHHLISQLIQQSTKAEEARLLYVAMTRARERLVMMGCLKKKDTRQTWSEKGGNSTSPLKPEVLLGANCLLDWIAPSLSPLPEEPASLHRDFWITFLKHTDAGGDCRSKLDLAQDTSCEKPWLGKLRYDGRIDDLPWKDEPQALEIERKIRWDYPQAALTRVPAKVSVSSIKSRLSEVSEADEQVERRAPLPERHRARIMDAMERGTIFHAVMQHLDLDAGGLTAEGLQRQIKEMARHGWVDGARCKPLDFSPILRFMSSPRGKWLIENRSALRRELPFCLAMPAQYAEPSQAIGEDERVVVQGVIDALIETPDGFWILDYKTDSVSESEVPDRAREYLPQMSIYAQAVQRILKRPVLGAVLVFLAAGESYEFKAVELQKWIPASCV